MQCDNGGEFKKAVEKLCKSLEVKIIRSSPYHPQSQGKEERSHRSLKKKILFDMLHLRKAGINWATQLREYQKVLNEQPMEVQGNLSPFQIFYGRESNSVSQRIPEGCCVEESKAQTSSVLPSCTDFEKNRKIVSRIRSKAKVCSRTWGKRYIERQIKSNPPSIYAIGETALIRFPFSRTTRIAAKRRFVLERKIIKRNLRLQRYNIAFESPITSKRCTAWISVEDVTSVTLEEEKRKIKSSKRRINKEKSK